MNNATQVDSRHTIQQQHKDEMCHNPRLQSLYYPLLLTTPANMETSVIVVILSVLGLGEAKITKTMDQWICDYCAMGNYHHQGRCVYDMTSCARTRGGSLRVRGSRAVPLLPAAGMHHAGHRLLRHVQTLTDIICR